MTMATIQEQIIVIKISKLVKSDTVPEPLVDEQTVMALEQVVEELLEDNVIVEIDTSL